MRISDGSSDVCSSDLEDIRRGCRFALGGAGVEGSHGRQHCWKIEHRFGARDVMATIVRTARCGIYFRVLREGEAEAGTRMELLERPLPQWPIARVFRLLIGGGHKGDPDAVRALADIDRKSTRLNSSH